MLTRGIAVTAIITVVAVAQMGWKQESGWIGTCTAAGCPGMRSICLTYVINGKTYYCYRNPD